MPTKSSSPPCTPPVKYEVPHCTRWDKEKAAAGGAGAFDLPSDPGHIGPRILGECVGKGASDRVNIARHRHTGQLAAVKIIPPHPSSIHVPHSQPNRQNQTNNVWESIIHHDLKHENILIASLDPPLIKIADWGMAAFVPPSLQLETSCGSPHYASLEIVNDKKDEGNTTDIWSCGVVLFALLTGRLPFDDKDVKLSWKRSKPGSMRCPLGSIRSPRIFWRRC